MESSSFWNPESTVLESGIRNPESGIHSMKSRIQDCPGFPYMGRGRRILGGRKLLYCNHHLCYDGGRLGRVKTVTLRVGARAKEGKRGGGGEKKCSSLSPPPTPLLLTRPIFSPLFNMRFREKNIRAPEENGRE